MGRTCRWDGTRWRPSRLLALRAAVATRGQLLPVSLSAWSSEDSHGARSRGLVKAHARGRLPWPPLSGVLHRPGHGSPCAQRGRGTVGNRAPDPGLFGGVFAVRSDVTTQIHPPVLEEEVGLGSLRGIVCMPPRSHIQPHRRAPLSGTYLESGPLRRVTGGPSSSPPDVLTRRDQDTPGRPHTQDTGGRRPSTCRGERPRRSPPADAWSSDLRPPGWGIRCCWSRRRGALSRSPGAHTELLL